MLIDVLHKEKAYPRVQPFRVHNVSLVKLSISDQILNFFKVKSFTLSGFHNFGRLKIMSSFASLNQYRISRELTLSLTNTWVVANNDDRDVVPLLSVFFVPYLVLCALYMRYSLNVFCNGILTAFAAENLCSSNLSVIALFTWLINALYASLTLKCAGCSVAVFPLEHPILNNNLIYLMNYY